MTNKLFARKENCHVMLNYNENSKEGTLENTFSMERIKSLASTIRFMSGDNFIRLNET